MIESEKINIVVMVAVIFALVISRCKFYKHIFGELHLYISYSKVTQSPSRSNLHLEHLLNKLDVRLSRGLMI